MRITWRAALRNPEAAARGVDALGPAGARGVSSQSLGRLYLVKYPQNTRGQLSLSLLQIQANLLQSRLDRTGPVRILW